MFEYSRGQSARKGLILTNRKRSGIRFILISLYIRPYVRHNSDDELSPLLILDSLAATDSRFTGKAVLNVAKD